MALDLNRVRNLATVAQERLSAASDPDAVKQARRPARGSARSWYRIENAANGEASIYLYDMIGEWGVSARDFINELRGLQVASIDLHVNCEGGEVFDGLAIYETLRRHPAAITAYVEGIAASAASYVVQAANRVVMAPRSMMMIHDAGGFAFGNARVLREMADLLEELSNMIADIYAEHAGGTRAQWRKAMQAAVGGPDGTWYDAKGAVAAGLADEIQKDAAPDPNLAKLEPEDEDESDDFDPTAALPARGGGRQPASAFNFDEFRSGFVGLVSEIENPQEPVVLPSASDLKSLFA